MTEFTQAERRRAGPLFNPDHNLWRDARYAWRMRNLASMVERKHNEALSHLVLAKQDVKVASAILFHERLNYGEQLKRGYVRDQLAFERYRLQKHGLAVLAAHDRCWAAQRALALWEDTYGV